MRIARLFGTPIRIDASWLLIFALLVWTLSLGEGPLAQIPLHWRAAAAALTALALFACVVAHELAHAAVARSHGIRTEEIVLFAFGGVSRMERVGASAAQEAQIALGGPVMSFALALVCLAAVPLFVSGSAPYEIFTYLGVVNAMLGAFNLLPAYPMDGGRIVHSAAWRISGDRLRATQFAVRASTAVGVLIALAGIALLLGGYILDGVWIALLAWFIMRAARTEYVSDTVIEPLAGVRCADLVEPPPGSFQPDMTCAAALPRMIELHRTSMPIAVGARLLGILALDDFAKLGTQDPAYVYVSAIMSPLAQLRKLAPDLSGLEALAELAASGHAQLPVVDKDGTLLGFISRERLFAAQVIERSWHITPR